ncbi:MAG: hypothetical protein ABWY80_06765 [Acidimicrobiia bacterium]
MKVKPTQVVVGIAGLAIGVLGVLSLREATLSTHGRVDPDSRVELVVHAQTHRPEPRQTLSEMVEALLWSCRLEVSSDIVGEVEALGDGRFRAVLQPALDETNRKQLTGCLEDWTIDSMRADVLSVHTLS